MHDDAHEAYRSRGEPVGIRGGAGEPAAADPRDDGPAAVCGSTALPGSWFEGDDEDEVIETDTIPGGWEAVDPTSVGARRRSGRRRVRARMAGAVLAEVAATVIATWRMDRGMSQTEAARTLGVGQPWLSRLERRRVPVTIELLVRIVGVTGDGDDHRRGGSGRARRPSTGQRRAGAAGADARRGRRAGGAARPRRAGVRAFLVGSAG